MLPEYLCYFTNVLEQCGSHYTRIVGILHFLFKKTISFTNPKLNLLAFIEHSEQDTSSEAQSSDLSKRDVVGELVFTDRLD